MERVMMMITKCYQRFHAKNMGKRMMIAEMMMIWDNGGGDGDGDDALMLKFTWLMLVRKKTKKTAVKTVKFCLRNEFSP